MKRHSVFGLTLLILLSTFVSGATASNQRRVNVIIMFNQNQDLDMVRNVGGYVKSVYRFQPAIAAVIPERAIEALQRNPAVKSVVRDLPIELVGQSNPWGVERIGALTVHSSGNKGAGVNVAILDSGIDKDHPDLSFVHGYDFSGYNDPDPEDYDGHGTHVAGTVAAQDNSIGVIGVAPLANLYVLKIFTDSGSGSYSDAVEALEYCIGTYGDEVTGNEIQVISMSWGSKVGYGDPGIESWINDAYDLGIVLVGAAGNEGNPPGKGDNVIYPARYDDVIAVAATDESDARALWSSTGQAVELSAPGVSVLSTYLGGGYAYGSGTSMACPHVSGTAALVLASDETFWASSGYTNGDGVWTNVEARTVLDETADDLGSSGRDYKYGHGLVDAGEATPTPTVDTTPPTASKETPAAGIYTNDATPTISVDVTDVGSGVVQSTIAMIVEGSPVKPTLTEITNGYHVEYTPTTAFFDTQVVDVTVDASDNAGNPMAIYAWSFTIDVTSPIITINSVETPTNVATQTITGTYTEVNIASIDVNGVTATIYEATSTYSATISLTEGSNTITATATDLAGNTGTATDTIVLDTIAPTITDLKPADGSPMNTATPTISATVTEASGIDTASIIMTVDGAHVAHTYDGVTGLVSYDVSATKPLAEGLHTVTLSVSDTVGNPATASWSFTVDTTPPAQVTGVTVTVVSSSQLDVSWTANTELDLDHYNVYRSTMSGGPYDLVASPITNSYSDTGLPASTTYYYIVTAVDKAGNEGTPSSEVSGTTSEAPALPTMHVASIDMSLKTAGINTNAMATVTIVDASGKPVEGATVYGHWEIATTDSDSGITDASGQVSLQSDKVKRAAPGTMFNFLVDRVELIGWTYDSSANVETSDSITV